MQPLVLLVGVSAQEPSPVSGEPPVALRRWHDGVLADKWCVGDVMLQ